MPLTHPQDSGTSVPGLPNLRYKICCKRIARVIGKGHRTLIEEFDESVSSDSSRYYIIDKDLHKETMGVD